VQYYTAVHYLRLVSHPTDGWQRQSIKKVVQNRRDAFDTRANEAITSVADPHQKASTFPACENPEDEAKNSRADLSR
jgi:hypothetical protein